MAATLWVTLTWVAIATRPLLPVDETRYAAVAWEMWLRGDFLVPHLNGATYSHKPPLLFWLIDAGWLAGGPSLLWTRLVGPLCAAVDFWLLHLLARRLWPRDGWRLALLAPLVLIGTLAWTVYGTLLLFDSLLTACVLTGMLGVVELRDGRRRGALLLAAGIGFGVLAKGPVVLLHLLPVTLLARWWDVVGRGDAAAGRPAGLVGRRWAGGVVAGILGGAALALLWAVPAALAGGPAYGREIFLGQTAGRMVRSFAHQRPAWWYLPQLLWMLLPWWPWPPLWRAARRAAREAPDRGIRFCLAWALPAAVAFSLVSGKQVHYLLPELSAVALLVARVLAPPGDGALPSPGRPAAGSTPVILPALLLAIPGAALALLAFTGDRLPPLADVALPSLPAVLLLAVVPPAIALAGASLLPRWLPRWLRGGAIGDGRAGGGSAARAAVALTTATVALVALAHAVVLPGIAARVDTGPVSRHLRRLEESGAPLAHVGPYAGQFAFPGRMRHSLQEIPATAVASWLAAHPGGRVVTYRRDAPPPGYPGFARRYRRSWVVVVGPESAP